LHEVSALILCKLDSCIEMVQERNFYALQHLLPHGMGFAEVDLGLFYFALLTGETYVEKISSF